MNTSKRIKTVLTFTAVAMAIFVLNKDALTEPVAPGRVFHVALTGGDGQDVLRTIQAAAMLAQPGDRVVVHEGVYRERVNPPRGGESEDSRIIYEAAAGETVVIKGSEIIKASINYAWQHVQNDTWMVVIPNTFFGDYNPYNEVIHGEWYKTPGDGWDRHTGAVYLNEEWLTEARDLNTVLQPAGTKSYWFGAADGQNTTIQAQFKGIDPNTEMVEINVRQAIFYPDQPGRNYITVRGFTMRQAATPWSGAMSEQIGLIGTHWSKGWIIENNVISHSMNTGITLGRYDLVALGIDMPAATAPGFVESVELALEHGWSKDLIGSHVVRSNHISHCEKNGIHGSLGGIFCTIEGNTIRDIGQLGWISGPDVAGLKLLASQDTIIRHNHFYRCGGFGGVWLDWMSQGSRFSGNLLHDNSRDLFVEVNHGPLLVDHNIFLSSANGLLESGGGGAYAHNLFSCKITLRGETRQTPYHTQHSTEMLGLATPVGDDERFHNNLFAGYNGLASYNKWTDRLQAVGNVYTAGANPSKYDSEAFSDAAFNPGITLEEAPADEWWLELSVDPAWLTAQPRGVVTTALLGSAIVPDAPFEQPDGTPYRLDTDYFGKKRNTENPSPGPFQFTSENVIRLKVWPKSDIAPEIDVFDGLAMLENGAATTTINLGTANVSDASLVKTLRVENNGSAGTMLVISGLSVAVPFVISEGLGSNIPAGGSDEFTITLPTTQAGIFSAVVRVLSDDADESPFEFTVTGTIILPPKNDPLNADNWQLN